MAFDGACMGLLLQELWTLKVGLLPCVLARGGHNAFENAPICLRTSLRLSQLDTANVFSADEELSKMLTRGSS